MYNKMSTNKIMLTIIAVIIALIIYYTTMTRKSNYFYYTRDGRMVEVKRLSDK